MAPIQTSARRSAASPTPWSQRTGGRRAPKPGLRLARHLKVFVAPPTAASPKLIWSARLPQIVRQPPRARALLPSVHQLQLSLTGESATEVLVPVPTVPARARPARRLACYRARPLSPTTQWRRAPLTARTRRAPVLRHSHLSCQMVTSADKPEVLATAAQAVAVSVEVRTYFFSVPV